MSGGWLATCVVRYATRVAEHGAAPCRAAGGRYEVERCLHGRRRLFDGGELPKQEDHVGVWAHLLRLPMEVV